MAETTVLRSSSINRTPNAGAKPQAQLSGVHKVVQVNMNSGGPQIQGGQGTVRQGVTLLPPKGARRTFQTGGLPNQPAKQGVVILPPKALGAVAGAPSLTADHLLLLRHLADKYLGELRASASVNVSAGPGEAPIEETTTGTNIKLAETALVAIDAAMTELMAAAALAATTAAAANAPAEGAAPPQRVVSAGTRSSQSAASATPRRVARPAPVVVKMEDGHPVPVTDEPDQPESAAQG